MSKTSLRFLLAFAPALSGADVSLTHDSASSGGYISAYTIAAGVPYADSVLNECSKAQGRQNEPSAAINPSNVNVILGSSNDYCGVYAGSPELAQIRTASAGDPVITWDSHGPQHFNHLLQVTGAEGLSSRWTQSFSASGYHLRFSTPNR